MPIAIVRDETARLDPPHSTLWKNYAVFHIVFMPLIAESLTTKSVQTPKVVWVHPIPPSTACRLGCTPGQSVDSGIPFRNLHLAIRDVVPVAADKGGSSRQGQLRIAFGQYLLGALAMRNVTGDAKQLHGRAMGVAHNRALNRDPSGLPGMGMARRWQHPILSLPVAAGVLCLCNGTADALEIFTMNEAPRLFNRGWQHGVPVNLRSTPVACDLTGSKVRTECPQRRSIKSELKAVRNLFDCVSTPAPFGKDRSKQDN
jgi:hypothetical protein